MLAVFVGLLAAALALLYWYLTSTFSYWRDKSVLFDPPKLLVGSMGNVFMLREHMSQFYQKLYDRFDGERFAGYFQGHTPSLLVRDPELVKNIMIKDFNHFVDHGFKVDDEVDPLQAKNLFNMEGHPWKEMRSKLSPTFTSGRMKAMFPLVLEVAERFEKHLDNLSKSKSDIDIKDFLARYTTDVISSCAFGLECDSLANPNIIFRAMGRKLLEPTFIQGLKTMLITMVPEIAQTLKLTFTPKVAEDFFRQMVSDVMKQRKQTKSTRRDFMQLLMEIKEKGCLAPEQGEENAQADTPGTNGVAGSYLTEDDVTAQAMVFFLAGFETSSSALTFALFELARRPELQQRARAHIEEVLRKHEGHVTYQALQDMTYLDWILNESLRKYPPLSMLNRTCTKNYTIPGTKVTFEKGNILVVPIHAIQNDPKYFPEPEKFEPERFSEENQAQRHQFTYIPFGEGPRQCIGLRFARMQSKLGLVAALRRFEMVPSERTNYPLTMDPLSFLLSSKEDVFVKAVRVVTV